MTYGRVYPLFMLNNSIPVWKRVDLVQRPGGCSLEWLAGSACGYRSDCDRIRSWDQLRSICAWGSDMTINVSSAQRQMAIRTAAAAALLLIAPNAIGQDPDLQKLGFGLGIGISYLNKDNIVSARNDNGIVRITDYEETKRGLWLETHYMLDKYAFCTIPDRLHGKKDEDISSHGCYASWGPFFGVQLFDQESNSFGAISFGAMVSFKRKPIGNADKGAWNIGVGYHNSKIERLADGYEAGQTLPVGSTDVLKRKQTDRGLMLMFSFNVY